MTRIADRVDTGGLEPLDHAGFPVFTSPGGQARGIAIAERCQRALDWLDGVFAERPQLTLIVAGREDWNRVALIPLYGMPHAVNGLVVCGLEPSDFWTDYTDALISDLPAAGRQRLTAIYGNPPKLGERFADLIVAHELAHLFHDYDEATGLTDFPRLWACELFANIAMHGYITETEPKQLPALEAICELTWQAPAARWPVRELHRMEHSLATGPLNYVWFQLRLLVIAKLIWQSGGATSLRAYRNALRRRTLTDDQIIETINAVAPDAAQALRHWPA
jgi:hypothetical protein